MSGRPRSKHDPRHTLGYVKRLALADLHRRLPAVRVTIRKGRQRLDATLRSPRSFTPKDAETISVVTRILYRYSGHGIRVHVDWHWTTCPSPELLPLFQVEWYTETVQAIAKRMYETGDFTSVPILADALEEAGCNNKRILSHLRKGHSVHCRGCWIVHEILGINRSGFHALQDYLFRTSPCYRSRIDQK